MDYRDRIDGKEPKASGWFGLVVGVGSFLIVLAALATACSPKVVTETRVEYRDTTIYRREVKDSLVYVSIPLESNQVIVRLGDTSKLETSVARSEAFVSDDGFLHHSLENKRDPIPVIVPVTNTYSATTRKEAKLAPLVIYQDKPLSWWQNLRIRAFWWLLGATIILFGVKYGKYILKLVKFFV